MFSYMHVSKAMKLFRPKWDYFVVCVLCTFDIIYIVVCFAHFMYASCRIMVFVYRCISRLMGKQTICISENKDADQLLGNREADQRLCFRFSDSTISSSST